MARPRPITFENVPVPAAADPARMDVALFVGFCPGLPAGEPVVVESAAGLTELIGRGQRPDSVPAVTGAALSEPIEDPALVVTVDGREHRVTLPESLGSAHEAFTAEIVTLGTGRHLRLTRSDRETAGRITVQANRWLGFPVAATAASAAIGATLPRAVASFFRSGGRRAWIMPMGGPGPYLGTRAERLARLSRLLGGEAGSHADPATLPLPPLPGRRELPERWHGPAAALGIEEAFLLGLPDLPELVSPLPEAPQAVLSPAGDVPELFVPCAVPPSARATASAGDLPPPRLDEAGAALWARVVRHLLSWLRAEAPDRMLLLSLPPGAEGALGHLPAEALELCQVAQPWLATPDGTDLAGGLVPPDGVLAGLLAGHTLTAGCFLSAASTPVPEAARLGDAADDPDQRTARFATGPAGITLAADHTPSLDPTGRHAAVRRLTALLLRTAAIVGADAVFEPSGERLWRDVEIRLELLLERLYAAGALRGRNAGEAFFARCGRTTMTPAEIAQGRVVAEVGFAPALPVERLQVRLALGAG